VAKAGTVRVATLNLWGRFADWPRRRELLRSELPRLEIDVYLLQEVVCGNGRGDQLREFVDMLGLDWTARVIAERRPHEAEEEGVAIASRLPLRDVAVWPLPPSHPPRHLLDATIDPNGEPVRLLTLHAAVSPTEERDRQIAELSRLRGDRILIGSDLNAPPDVVEAILGPRLRDTLDWDETPTWPVDEQEFVQAWKEKLGEEPGGDVEPRRLDYLLVRGLSVSGSAAVALADESGSASDHRLVWADVSSS
jgi:endonuclease/exonuclease/phosphatase family metal-dependent hydrolase